MNTAKNIMLTCLFSLITLSSFQTSAAEIKEVKQTFNGLTVNANLLMADDKNYSDGIVLLTHGTLTHKGRSTYQQLQKNLASLGVSSLAINLSLAINDRQGEYDCNVTHKHKHTNALNEIDFWVKWLQKQGTKKISLVGHSRGGNQTAWYASIHDSDSIKSVILIAPATGSQQSAEDYQQKYKKSLESLLNQANKLIKSGNGNQIMNDIDFIYCKKAKVTASSFVDYYAKKPQFDTPLLLKETTKPTLVVIGSDDNVVPELPERLKPLEAKGTIQTITIDDADHFFLDFANEDLANAIAEFIQ
jgi:alpha-beta hydrolase superfamily lysophospholipase